MTNFRTFQRTTKQTFAVIGALRVKEKTSLCDKAAVGETKKSFTKVLHLIKAPTEICSRPHFQMLLILYESLQDLIFQALAMGKNRIE